MALCAEECYLQVSDNDDNNMTKYLHNKGINKDITLVHCNDVKFLRKINTI